jgi:hypothetical protein
MAFDHDPSKNATWRYPDTISGVHEWLLDIERGERASELARSTASAYRGALLRVCGPPESLSVPLRAWPEFSERMIADFLESGRAADLRPNSIESYVARARAAVEHFRKARAEESVMPGGAFAEVRSPVVGHGRPAGQRGAGMSDASMRGTRAAMVEYRLPLLDGTSAELRLPRHLQRADARRLARFVAALVMDDEGGEPAL